MAVALARQGRPREAWKRWEADLARGLLDDLTARTLRPLSAAERQGETELLVRLGALDEQIARLTGRPRRSPGDESRLELLFRERDTLYGKYAEFEQSLAAAHGDFTGRPADLEQIQAALPAQTALVGWIDLGDAARAPRSSLGLHCAEPGRARLDRSRRDRTSRVVGRRR